MSPTDDPLGPDDDRLAAYLDGALTEAERAALEARLLQDPSAMHHLCGLYRSLRATLDPAQEVPLAEQYLAGETLPFTPPLPEASPVEPSAYDSLSAAVEERKRRYLRFGN